MATDVYSSLLKTVAGYVSEVKARDIIERQMAKCGATADTLAAENFKVIAHRIAGAAGLYVSDPARRMELARKITALAGL